MTFNKRIPLLLLLFSIFYQCASAQLINPPIGREFGLSQKYNSEYIASNHIEEITCDVDIKKDGERIRDLFQKVKYHFYPDGKVKMISLINQKLRDTSITFYEYVGNRLDCEVKNDAAGMFSYCYTYDNDGRPLTQKYGRAARVESLTASINPAISSKITSEKYEYVTYENQLHSTLYNAQGRPYLKEIRYFDANGYLIKYLQTYIMSSGQIIENYAYDAHGWLATKDIDDGKDSYSLSYEYDEVGNLLTEIKTVDGEVIYRKEFVYNEKNMRLTAELKREEKNQLIVITTYTYTPAN